MHRKSLATDAPLLNLTIGEIRLPSRGLITFIYRAENRPYSIIKLKLSSYRPPTSPENGWKDAKEALNDRMWIYI